MSIRHLPYQIDESASRFHYYENFWKRKSIELLLKHSTGEGMTLLDYGCGRGETLQLASAAGFKAVGADVDPECVRIASKFGETCVLDWRDPVGQFKPKSFDVVACFHVLEHVDNPKEVLNSLATIARDYVLIAVPNLRYLHRLFARRINLSCVNEGHLQSWDHWHLRNLAERHCGLELVEWGFDATMLPFISGLAGKVAGQKAAIWLETTIFRRMFPFHGISIIGLFRIKRVEK